MGPLKRTTATTNKTTTSKSDARCETNVCNSMHKTHTHTREHALANKSQAIATQTNGLYLVIPCVLPLLLLLVELLWMTFMDTQTQSTSANSSRLCLLLCLAGCARLACAFRACVCIEASKRVARVMRLFVETPRLEFVFVALQLWRIRWLKLTKPSVRTLLLLLNKRQTTARGNAHQ